MEETKEKQKLYGLFQSIIYFSIIIEIIIFVPSIVQIPFLIIPLSKFIIYSNIFYSKLATILIVSITTIGTKNKKKVEFNIKKSILLPLLGGAFIVLFSIFILNFQIELKILNLYLNKYLYMIFSFLGIILIHISLDNVSKIFQAGNIAKDKFNVDNESFAQQDKKIENKYSINIPTVYYYKGKIRKGWINIVNPFRGTWVIGTPGSGKTFSIIEPIIRQHSQKGFALVVYDYKFPTLARKVYYHYVKNKKAGNVPKNCKFNMVNFTDVEYSRRINPIQRKYIPTLGAASETASTLIESLQKGKKEGGGGGSDDFFKTAAENFLAAIIYFFVRYENGKYSDMPHILSFMNQDYVQIFDVLMTDEEIYPLLAPFRTAYLNKAMDQLEGMIGSLRVYASRLATKEAFWVFGGDDFDLKVSNPDEPSYLIIANDPEMESITGSLNALILNRLITRINSGEGKNIPTHVIVDELPTLYFHKIDRLVGTARSNKVAVTLGFQEIPQLEGDYGKVGTHKVLSVCANIVCAAARNKETLGWLSNEIFGKVRQIKQGLSITHSKTTVSQNEEMGNVIPASKIADMPTGFLCGQIARDFVKTKKIGNVDILKSEEYKTTKFYAKTNFNMKLIKEEEKKYIPLPKFYDFGDLAKKEKILTNNFRRINNEVLEMCNNILSIK